MRFLKQNALAATVGAGCHDALATMVRAGCLRLEVFQKFAGFFSGYFDAGPPILARARNVGIPTPTTTGERRGVTMTMGWGPGVPVKTEC